MGMMGTYEPSSKELKNVDRHSFDVLGIRCFNRKMMRFIKGKYNYYRDYSIHIFTVFSWIWTSEIIHYFLWEIKNRSAYSTIKKNLTFEINN